MPAGQGAGAAQQPAAPSASDARLAALALLPKSAFVLTAAYGEARGGIMVRWVQQVSAVPPLVVVAIEKGQPLSPIIRDSRRFALCQVPADDRILHKLFDVERGDVHARGESSDPFLGLATLTTAGGVPVPLKAMAWLDCELTRHLDVEGNCELYIGLVHAGAVLRAPEAPTAAPQSTTTAAAADRTGPQAGRFDVAQRPPVRPPVRPVVPPATNGASARSAGKNGASKRRRA